MIFRYDFVLSIWIFVWFLLYFFQIITYSPILILLIASIIDTIAIFYKIYNRDKKVFKFFIIQCIIKYIPLYLIWNYQIFTINNTVSSVIFVLLYFLYMYINVGNISDIIKIYDRMLKTTTSQNTNDDFPLTALWNKFEKK